VKTACCLLLFVTAAAVGVSDVLSVVARTLFVLLDQAQSSDLIASHHITLAVRPSVLGYQRHHQLPAEAATPLTLSSWPV